MYRRFIAFVAAASIAITAFSALPARAGDKEVAKALAAVLGVAVVGKIIHDNRKDRLRKRRVVTRSHPTPVYTAPRRQTQPRARQVRKTPQIKPRPLPDLVRNEKLLPGKCFRSYDGQRETVRMFERTCLDTNFRHTRLLPQQCKVQVNTENGSRFGYQATCLRDAGYKLARG